MICCPQYNPNTDIKPVSPTGALDLKAAFANNAIPSDLSVQEGKFNGIDDPASIAGRITDNIDAAMCEKSIGSYAKDAEGDYNKEGD